jgi:hypothetical protein
MSESGKPQPRLTGVRDVPGPNSRLGGLGVLQASLRGKVKFCVARSKNQSQDDAAAFEII